MTCLYSVVALDLLCTMPEGYPESSPPEVTIDIKKGIGEKQKPEIDSLIQAQIEENAGCASMYIIAEAMREWLVDNNVEGQVMAKTDSTVLITDGRSAVAVVAVTVADTVTVAATVVMSRSGARPLYLVVLACVW